MRLDARRGDIGWHVWHVPRCELVRYCVWVDDATAQYGAWESSRAHIDALIAVCGIRLAGDKRRPSPEPPTHQARRITIHAERRLVLIDPIEDEDHESVADVIAAARTAPAEHELSPVALAPAYPAAAFASLKRRDLHAPGLTARGLSLT